VLPSETAGSEKLVAKGTTVNRIALIRKVMREERKPTRCNNIDDLLSIVDVDY